MSVCLVLACCGEAPAFPEGSVEQLPLLRIEPELRIGDAADPEVGFSSVGAVDVDRDGNILIFEALATEIRLYDPQGGLVRRMGRRGEGPGEFRMVGRMGVLGDTIYAIDVFNRRITLYSRSGTLLKTLSAETVQIPVHEAEILVTPMALRADGNFVGAGNVVRGGHVESNIPADSVVPIPRVLFDSAGEVVDTVGWDESPSPGLVRPPGFEDRPYEPPLAFGSQRFRIPEAPTGMPRWAMLDDGRIIIDVPVPQSESAELRVTRLSLTGDTIFHRRLAYRAARYTDAVLDSIAGESARDPSGGAFRVGEAPPARLTSGDPLVVNALRGKMEFPHFQPLLANSWVGSNGSTWLRTVTGGGGNRWIVIDPEGRVRGQVDLPPRARPVWSGDDHFLTVEPDELDVPWLVRYRIIEG